MLPTSRNVFARLGGGIQAKDKFAVVRLPEILVSKFLSVSGVSDENPTKDHDEFTQKKEMDKKKAEQERRDADADERIREKLLTCSLKFVPAHGWTHESVEAGAKSLGYPLVTGGVIKSPAIDLLHHHSKISNLSLVELMKERTAALKKEELLNSTSFVRRSLEERLRMNTPYLSRWSDAMAIMSYPANAPQSLSYDLELVDSIWHHAGDNSTDYNWYTKRLSLLAIYKATELAMMQDKSSDFADSWSFLDRRMADYKSVSGIFLPPEDSAKVFGAIGTTLKSLLGVPR